MKFVFALFFCILYSVSISAEPIEIVYPPQGSSLNRIVGGVDAEDGYAPYQCSLQVRKSHFCGCSILSSKWVLTASHCVDGQMAGVMQVFVGTNNLKQGGTYYNTSKLIKHSRYNRPVFANDIALILIDGAITFNDKVRAVDIATEDVSANTPLQLTGWGRLTAGGSLPQKLQVITLNSITYKECYRLFNGQSVDIGHICTYNKVGEGACNGDSGGPLVLKNGNLTQVIGVVNFGVPCARGKPDAFAKVPYYHDWIRTTINSN